jgi:hypothetical protein
VRWGGFNGLVFLSLGVCAAFPLRLGQKASAAGLVLVTGACPRKWRAEFVLFLVCCVSRPCSTGVLCRFRSVPCTLSVVQFAPATGVAHQL